MEESLIQEHMGNAVQYASMMMKDDPAPANDIERLIAKMTFTEYVKSYLRDMADGFPKDLIDTVRLYEGNPSGNEKQRK